MTARAPVARLELRAITLKAAREFVGQIHRHNRPPQGGLFALRAEFNGSTVGVAIVGRPVSPSLDDGSTAEITRCCTDGTRNACSFLYGAARRAAAALGYRRLLTYTLQTEPGTSLRAAGFVKTAEVPKRAWDRPNRRRKPGTVDAQAKFRGESDL